VGVAATIAPGVIDSVATPDQRFLYVECSGAGELLAYRVNHDGTLHLDPDDQWTADASPSVRGDRRQLKRLQKLWRPTDSGRHSGRRSFSNSGADSQWRARFDCLEAAIRVVTATTAPPATLAGVSRARERASSVIGDRFTMNTVEINGPPLSHGRLSR